MTPEQKAEYKEKLKTLHEERKASREERGKKRRAELKAELGAKALGAPIREELKHHAWRVARLRRLIELAEASDRPELKERAEKLLVQEDERHTARLAKLKNAKADAMAAKAEKKADTVAAKAEKKAEKAAAEEQAAPPAAAEGGK